ELSSESTLPLIAAVYLGIDRKVGARLALAFVVCDWLVYAAKSFLHSPRPFWVDPRVQAFDGAGSYGMPSGHVALAVCGWLLLAIAFKKKWLWVIVAGITFAVSLWRVYLGVHFISDGI